MAKWGTAVQSRDEQYGLKRAALIREAGRAFGRNGFHNTSLEEIAKRLNVTKPALYYYVKNKHELLYECQMAALDLGEEAIGYGQSNGRSGADKLDLFLRRYITLLTSELGASAVLSEFTALLPEDAARVRTRRVRIDRILRDMVAEGIADGSLRPCDPKLAVFWFMGAVNGISRWFREDGPEPGEAIAANYAAFILEGLGAPRRGQTTQARPAKRPAAAAASSIKRSKIASTVSSRSAKPAD